MNTAFLQLLEKAKTAALAVFGGQSQTVSDAIEFMASHISAGLAQQDHFPSVSSMVQQEPQIEDREIAQLVNTLTKTAIEFHDAQQLRQRISQLVVPALKAKAQQEQPPELSESDMLKIYTAATGRHIKVKEEGERRNVFRLMKAVETHCREGVSPLPRPTRWAALNAVTDEWNRRDRPSRPHQAAIIIAADLALDIAEELEFIAEKIRQGHITEGAGGGSGFNWSWCVISDQGGQQ